VQKDPAFAQALLDDAIMIQKPSLSPKYVKDIVLLLDQGEERLIESVQRGTTPLQ
jgi:ParB family chromosome partitioning protein